MAAKREQRRIVAHLHGLPPSLRFGDLRQAKVNALRKVQSAGGDASRVAPVLWAPSGVDAKYFG
jgi:hypothetical protein